MSAVFKGGLTRIGNNNARRMSSKVIAKGIASGIVGGSSTSVALGTKNGIVEQYVQSNSKHQNNNYDQEKYYWKPARRGTNG